MVSLTKLLVQVILLSVFLTLLLLFETMGKRSKYLMYRVTVSRSIKWKLLEKSMYFKEGI